MKKTALITGASSGLGLEFAKIYAKNEYNLLIIARSEGKLYQLKTEIEKTYGVEVVVYAKDLSEKDAGYDIFDFCLENSIQVDVLVNNAGFGDFSNFVEADWEKQYNMVQVNIVTLMQLTRCFAPLMVKRKNGRILNLSSVAAFCAGPKMSVYYASKEYVRSFSEALAEELKGTGVTVTALCPGPTSTGFEMAAEMKNSKMFTFFKPATAKEVAEAGFKACEKGKTLKYYGISTKLMNIGSRLIPRSVSRKFAMKING
ncbi:SDR family NAD(P)-dependent oxidoreductase [Thomasclavelia ramosa]|uniref:SDR family NAD(P)-dependent oxidoreductase n=2 Tax=Bacillati TaxID=1783272 RepID=UPI001D090571|nr:SDR family oxidoreductase [Thomasclavelia ramosa]MCB6435853.1 SDR family oxidoreductase [Thomasclavelia ramosa]MCB6458902.1 SDR family oxidoreductase [Thomasclavelia ramosa]MCB6597118.1 SDR family oxidoreductase [Thomasclavelia ramosa]MCB6600623.1 SDR family oxidoreductase [Thomasclavelia ramosa]MCB6618698.1 SDR family oxidoreductase [Thomasclavelia ramosa]